MVTLENMTPEHSASGVKKQSYLGKLGIRFVEYAALGTMGSSVSFGKEIQPGGELL